MTYPPRAPRVGRMDSGYSPQQWGRKIKRLKVGKKKREIKLSRRTSVMPAGKTQRTQRGSRLSRRVLLRQNQPIEDKRSDLCYHILSLVPSKAELLRRTTTFIAAPVPADRTKLETFGRRQTRGTKLGWEINPFF
jgi:hypothetical protein